MEDPNRPVTGYPVNTNGYSINPPPAGTAYPYAAPNSYTSYQNYPYSQQSYQPDPALVRRATCVRRIFAFIVGLVIISGTIAFIAWIVLRPQLPEFRVDSFSFSNFIITNDSLVSFTSEARLTARNPNKKMTVDYDHIVAMILYKSETLSDTTVPPFFQDTKNETSLKANFAAAGSFVDKSVVDGINNERDNNGNVGFRLRMFSTVRLEAKAWPTRKRSLKVFCEDLAVAFPSNGRSGTLTSGPKQCHVGF
ncbi:YLS9-like [Olea europaea subsp. europaea]|uniref:YLS9-like n=1 Tax=Olea europaea subsp. europaea TaxID=158383 RepID=A0A8S0R8U1_OLEEU|nr:YLS9-like [Olea europaea subsp. europaea]